MNSKIIDELAKEIMGNQAKILDDFGKAYLSSLDKKCFLKLKEDGFRRLELVETIESPTKRVYHFRLKKGRLPKVQIGKI